MFVHGKSGKYLRACFDQKWIAVIEAKSEAITDNLVGQQRLEQV